MIEIIKVINEYVIKFDNLNLFLEQRGGLFFLVLEHVGQSVAKWGTVGQNPHSFLSKAISFSHKLKCPFIILVALEFVYIFDSV